MLLVDKILKEAYETSVWYHGSKYDFNSFKTRKGSFNSTEYINPIFLTSDKDFAKAYAGYQTQYIYTVEVLTDKIFDFNVLVAGYEIEKTSNKLSINLYNYVSKLFYDNDRYYNNLRTGDYSEIEQEWFFEWLKKNKFDGAYVIETGILNLFVFDPFKLKIIGKEVNILKRQNIGN